MNETNFLNQLRSAEKFATIVTSEKKPTKAGLGGNDSFGRTVSIPNLPEGKQIRLEISSTWGDSHYVGLSGIEFFSADGE